MARVGSQTDCRTFFVRQSWLDRQGANLERLQVKNTCFCSFDSNFVEVVSRSYQKLICKNVSRAVAWCKS